MIIKQADPIIFNKCRCSNCIKRDTIQKINEMIARADKRLREENLGITDDWNE